MYVVKLLLLLIFLLLGASPPALADRANTGCRVSLLQLDIGKWIDAKGTVAGFKHQSDVDGDGKLDLLSLSRGGDSWVKLMLSRSGKTITVPDPYMGNDEMFQVQRVPKTLTGKRMAAARRLVEDALFKKTCYRLHPSLELLLQNNSKRKWQKQKPTFPNYAVYYLPAAQKYRLLRKQKITGPIWVRYLGNTHRWNCCGRCCGRMRHGKPTDFKNLAENARFRLLGTAHGVVAYDKHRHRYAWVYAFPGESGHKLRWPRIKRARLGDNRAIITLDVPLEPGNKVVSAQLLMKTH